jgi:hypothetical protein
VFPALAAGALASTWTGAIGGVAVGATTLVLGVLLARRLLRRASRSGPTGPTS